MSLTELRQKHPRFHYQSFDISPQENTTQVTFHFLIEPDISFAPTITLPFSGSLNTASFQNLVFHLGLVEMISYWKTTCSPEILIEAGSLSAEQISWWKKLLLLGLGEFFYSNQIDFTEENFVTLSSTFPNESNTLVNETAEQFDGNVILISGGKDSSVMLKTLSDQQAQSRLLMVNPTEAALQQAEVAGYNNPLIVRRQIDPKLLDLNQQGYLNGHTPFSAYLAFLGITIASVFQKKHVIVANEKSASEPNLMFKGFPINHQYSKSFEFESDVRQYVNTFLTKHIEYFSILRPIYDLQVSQLFAQFTEYHSVFRSCNVGQNQNIWCGHCPKCAFVFLMLSPFFHPNEMVKIFGSNLFNNQEIVTHLRALVGIEKQKPFECVGTIEESKLAVALTAQQYQNTGQPIPEIIQELSNTLQLTNAQEIQQLQEKVLKQWSDEHFLPTQFSNLLH